MVHVQKIKRFYDGILCDDMTFNCTLNAIHEQPAPLKHKFFDLDGTLLPTLSQIHSIGLVANLKSVYELAICYINDVAHYCLYDNISQLKHIIIAMSKDNYPHSEDALDQDVKTLKLFKEGGSLSDIYIERDQFKLANCTSYTAKLGPSFLIEIRDYRGVPIETKVTLKKNKEGCIVLKINKGELRLFSGLFISSELFKFPKTKKEVIVEPTIKTPKEQLNALGITSKQEWRKWTIANHPDTSQKYTHPDTSQKYPEKLPETQVDFSDIIEAGRSMGW